MLKGSLLRNLSEAFALVREGAKRVVRLIPIKLLKSWVGLHFMMVTLRNAYWWRCFNSDNACINALSGGPKPNAPLLTNTITPRAKWVSYTTSRPNCRVNLTECLQKKNAAYAADITYKQRPHDYYWQHVLVYKSQMVNVHWIMRCRWNGLNLIDEARTPLIICFIAPKKVNSVIPTCRYVC